METQALLTVVFALGTLAIGLGTYWIAKRAH